MRVKRRTQRPRRRGCSTGPIPTKAQKVNHVWTWDFLGDRTDNGGKLRILSILDEDSRECLVLQVARQLTAADLIAVMEGLVAPRGVPGHLRSDNGSEFVARPLQSLVGPTPGEAPLHRAGQPLAERPRRELPRLVARRVPGPRTDARAWPKRACVLVEDYRRHHHNGERPHGGLGYRTPRQAFVEAQASHPKAKHTVLIA